MTWKKEEITMGKFQKATKKKARLRMALHGPSGSGKTYSALAIATHLGGRVAFLDTERGSAAKYSDKFDFDVIEEEAPFHPEKVSAALAEAVKEGYDAIIIDSLSLFWNGQGGMLEIVEQEAKKAQARSGKYDSYGAWKVVDPIYRKMIQAMLGANIHVIATMRAKQEYVKEENERGKTTIRKVGMAPEMRDAATFEFDIEGMIDIDHNLVIGKTRCDALDGKVFTKPGKDVADILKVWLADGVDAPVAKTEPTPAPKAPESSPSTQPESQPTVEKAAPDYEARAAYFRTAIAEATSENITALGKQVNEQLIGHPELYKAIKGLATAKYKELKAAAAKPEEAA